MPLPPVIRTASARSRGFTLVEMILVVAVIGVVMALLFSALGQVRVRSANAKCLQQLRQLGSAGLLYAADNGGRLPYRGDWAHPVNPAFSILPYLGLPLRESGVPASLQSSVLTCPAAQQGDSKTEQEFYRTYSINQYATGGEAGSAATITTWENHVAARKSPRRLQEVKHPAQQSFFMDGTGLYDSANFATPTYRYSAFQSPDRLTPAEDLKGGGSWRTPFVHHGTINVVYLDGHISPLSKQEAENGIIGPTNSAGTTRKNLFWGAEL